MSNVKDARYYEDLLESEGLGVVEVDTPYQGLNFGHIKGKWARLDAMINKLPEQDGKKKHPSYMTNSPVTARGTSDVESESKPINFHDYALSGDSVWDNFITSLTATPKEAEIADRARGSICGLDDEHRVIPLKPARRYREPGKEWRKRIIRHILGEVAGNGPLYSKYEGRQPPYAVKDGGNGPLSIVDLPRSDYDWIASSEDQWALEPEQDQGNDNKPEQVRMAPVVDTMGYLPGRSPFQMSRIMQSNSDITG